LPVDDAFAKGKVQENGSMVHDMYLFEVKKPSGVTPSTGFSPVRWPAAFAQFSIVDIRCRSRRAVSGLVSHIGDRALRTSAVSIWSTRLSPKKSDLDRNAELDAYYRVPPELRVI
jgi:hypothetical protein